MMMGMVMVVLEILQKVRVAVAVAPEMKIQSLKNGASSAN